MRLAHTIIMTTATTKTFHRFVLWTIVLFSLQVAAQDSGCSNTPPAEIRGKHFYTQQGDILPIVGLSYAPRPNSGPLNIPNQDLFTDEYRSIWERDLLEFQNLHINVLRLHSVDPTLNHDAFFCALQQLGIYAFVTLSSDCEECQITTTNPPDCYPRQLRERGQAIIAEFSKYDNVMGFIADDEASFDYGLEGQLINAPCQKRFIRDMRAYINSCSQTMRQIPVGVTVADMQIELQGQYYSCRGNADDMFENADWFGLNTYRFCNGEVTEASEMDGYQRLLNTFTDLDLPIPVFFAHFGCINPTFPDVGEYWAQRNFRQVQAIFDEEFFQEFAGGIASKYNTDTTDLADWPYKAAVNGSAGVVYYTPEDCDDIDVPCEVVEFPQFQFLADAYAGVTVSAVATDNVDDRTVTCPDEIPPLDDFDWSGNDLDTISTCPTHSFVCQCDDNTGGVLSNNKDETEAGEVSTNGETTDETIGEVDAVVVQVDEDDNEDEGENDPNVPVVGVVASTDNTESVTNGQDKNGETTVVAGNGNANKPASSPTTTSSSGKPKPDTSDRNENNGSVGPVVVEDEPSDDPANGSSSATMVTLSLAYATLLLLVW